MCPGSKRRKLSSPNKNTTGSRALQIRASWLKFEAPDVGQWPAFPNEATTVTQEPMEWITSYFWVSGWSLCFDNRIKTYALASNWRLEIWDDCYDKAAICENGSNVGGTSPTNSLAKQACTWRQLATLSTLLWKNPIIVWGVLVPTKCCYSTCLMRSAIGSRCGVCLWLRLVGQVVMNVFLLKLITFKTCLNGSSEKFNKNKRYEIKKHCEYQV